MLDIPPPPNIGISSSVPPPPPSAIICHPLQDHCRVGRGFESLSDITLDGIPLHRIVLCQSGLLKRYFIQHPNEKELSLEILLNSSDCSKYSREIVDTALNFVYGTNVIGTILRNEEVIVYVFKWLLSLEFYSTLQYVVNSIDSSVKKSVYFKLYGDVLLVPNFGRSSWENTNITEIQNLIEQKIKNNSTTDIDTVKDGIKEYCFSQMVALVERILQNRYEVLDILCAWAEENEERTASLGELLLIWDQAKNIPTAPPIIQKPPHAATTTRTLRPVLTRPPSPPPVFNPPSALRLFDSDDDDNYSDDDW